MSTRTDSPPAGTRDTAGSSKDESPRRRFWRRFRRQKMAMVMLGVVVVLCAIALVAPWIVPMDPNQQDLSAALQGPSAAHPFGTDELGRDLLSRMIAASTVTIYAGVFATAVSLALGLPLGLLAGLLRGPVDAVLSRIADAIMAIPSLLLALAIVAMLGPGATPALLAIGIANAPRFFRVVRSVTLVVREETFVEAARSVGVGNVGIMARHILPNIASPLIVQISLTIGFSILFEASLSFLGLGVQPPDASWGSMLRNATQFGTQMPLLVILPGMAIFLTVLAFNIVGDGIRDSVGREIKELK